MLEIMLYGALCSLASLCGIPAMMYRSDGLYAIIGGITMSLFWCANAMLWMNNGVEFFAFIDASFLIATAILWWIVRCRWIGLLACLFAGNLVLDFLFLAGQMGYPWFSRASNLLFVAELACVSSVGWSVMPSVWKRMSASAAAIIVTLLGLISFQVI